MDLLDSFPGAGWQEADRLAALRSYDILDTPREAEFDDIVQMAAKACDAPIALMNLIDRDRQWFKAETGLGVRQLPVRPSICTCVLGETDMLLVGDLLADARFADNPLVTGPPHARFYAGVPLRTAAGLPIGVLCVVDRQPRTLTEQQAFILQALGRAVMARLEQRRAVVERNQAQAQRRQSEARSQQILDSAIDYGIISFDLSGRVTSWNEGARRILGWTEAEMLGEPAERFFTAEDVAAGAAATEMGQALTSGRGQDERWHLRRDGTRFWASGEMMTLRNEVGRVDGFIKILRDRTEQLLAVHTLRDSQRRIETALETGLVGFFEWDVSGGLIRGDARFAAFYGLTPERMAEGVPPGDLLEVIHPDDAAASADNIRAAMVSTGDYTRQLRVVHSGNRCRWLLIRGRCDERDAGTARRYIGIVIDITATKEAEGALQDLNETLEAQISTRTDDLASALNSLQGEIAGREHTEAKLRQSQKMEAVGQLTGGLAHDFNNLLTGIMGSLELLQTRVSQGRIGGLDRYIGAAQEASRRAAALTHRLLAFSRQQTLDPRPTDINRLVVGMEEMIRRTVGPSIEIEVFGNAALWTTLVDPNQLENALLNLCINARDAMPDGGRLTIRCANAVLDERMARERDLPPGDYLSLCIDDTGTGMSPEVIKRAFDPFFTTKPLGLGTGLGLSMIYGFVRQSGGHVRITSEAGHGTTMALYLPRHVGEAELPDAPASRLAGVAHAEPGETVLVVDDEPVVRMLVAEVLEDLGYVAIEAADGAGGLRVLGSDVRIDLLISDVGLPGGMNGRQMADAGRVMRPGLKVLFITGYAENAVVGGHHLEPGMHVLTKPFPLDVLARRIRDLIASVRTPPPGPAGTTLPEPARG